MRLENSLGFFTLQKANAVLDSHFIFCKIFFGTTLASFLFIFFFWYGIQTKIVLVEGNDAD